MHLKTIQTPIATEISTFKKKFRAHVKSDFPLLDKMTNDLCKKPGKCIRPMFVFLTAGMYGGITEKTHRGAILIELLHTATLIHDDVVDDATHRRNNFSIKAIWKNKAAVLLGDYLFAQSLFISAKNKDYDLLEIVAGASKKMVQGELLQIAQTHNLDIKEDVYLEIIRQKTAVLIATCFVIGACTTQATSLQIEKMYSIGEKVGMVFQIKDDLLDYGGKKTGKSLGIDLKEKIITLPLIYALQQAPAQDRQYISNVIEKHQKQPEKLAEVATFIENFGGIAYAEKMMKKYYEEAIAVLQSLKIKNSIYKEALYALIQYTIQRP